MIARESWIMRAGVAAGCLLGAGALLSPALALTVDFESPAYIHDQTIDMVDGWSRSSQQGGLPEAFRTFAESSTLGGNKWMRVSTEGVSTLFREFPANSRLLDVQWKWRPADAKVDACLGVSSGNDNARAATRARVCFHPGGDISVVELLLDSEHHAKATWTPGIAYFMRMRLDHAANSYSLHMATDSLRADEALIAGPVKLAGLPAANFVRAVVSTGNGSGNMDIDDIRWESVAFWMGTEDSLASNPRNWSTGALPDSLTQVVFDAQAARAAVVDRPGVVRSVSVEPGFAFPIHFGANFLALTGNGNFTSLKGFTATTGGLRLLSSRGQGLAGPVGGSLPHVLHDGPGVLRLEARALFARSLSQTVGTLDLNKNDIYLEGVLSITGGGPASVRNLEGRTLSAGRARFEGASASSRISLRAATGTWAVTFTDSLTARFADLQGSRNVNTSRKGLAIQSADLGSNENWDFLAGSGPTLTAHPTGQTLSVGRLLALKVSAQGNGLPLAFQWFRDGTAVAGGDSLFTKAVALADAGDYACKVSTTAGSVLSNAAPVVVEFKAPTALPGSSAFADSVSVTLTSEAPGAHLQVSRNGGPFGALAGPLRLAETTMLKARAILGKDTSAVGEWSYVKAAARLDMPVVTPPGALFPDSMTVTLSPPASAPLAGVFYRVNDGQIRTYDKPIPLKETSVIKAFAILGAESSDTAVFTFIKTLAAPIATPAGREFPDTVRIALASATADAEIRYTLDGRPPETAGIPYTGPFLLDSTAVLKAVTFKNGVASSTVLSQAYELVPHDLSASPGSGDFTAGIAITLASTSRRARIYYTLDGAEPGPGTGAEYLAPIRLDSSAVLKAVAAAGQGSTLRMGRTLTQAYSLIKVGVHLLGPGRDAAISARYTLSNPMPGGPQVQYEVMPVDSLQGVMGFRDIQFGLRVTLPSGTAGFPQVRLGAPSGEERFLYGLTPGGAVSFVASEDTVDLPGPGTYFLGVDTLPPQITLSGETFVGDSTRILFTVKDNVTDLQLDLERSDDPERNFANRGLTGQQIITATLKAPSAWAPLWIKLRARDRRNTRHFPADPAAEYLLARRTTEPQRSPLEFRIGSRADQPWDMLAIPLEIDERLTFGALRALNPVKGLAANVWDPAANRTRVLRDDEPLPAGQALWVGAPTSLSSLVLPTFQTSTRQSKETYSIKLKPGWNQVANPTLRPLIWPVSRKGFGYLDSKVKGLHGFDPSRAGTGYFHADTLRPWRGYFVLNATGKDTTVALRAAPVPAAKRGAGTSLSLRLVLGGLPTLSLGAAPGLSDGLGVEDEPQPPAYSDADAAGPRLWSARGRIRLGTDWQGWAPGAVQAWSVVARTSHVTSEPGLTVEGIDLPEGHAAFAVSRARGLKFALAGAAVIPLIPGAMDTLDVLVGPAAALASRLGSVPAAVDAFRISALPRPGGYTLSLALPHAASLRWALWSADGREQDAHAAVLAPGFYQLPRQGRAGPLPAGLYVLRLDWAGDGKSGRLTRKMALP